MSVTELQVISNFMERATCPEDVFGKLPGNAVQGLKTAYRYLAKALHPDKHMSDPAALSLAKILFQQLEDFNKEALARIADGTYGQRKPLPGKIPVVISGKYVIERPLCAGDLADLYVASKESSSKKADFVLKVARNASDNDLLRNEQAVIDVLQERLPDDTWATTVPKVVDGLLLDTGVGLKRRMNVMTNFSGFYNGEEIRRRVPGGVDARTLVWMWKRLILLIEWTYKIGYIHGAVLPPHVMFYPDNDGAKIRDIRKHSIRLVDWTYAIEHRTRTRLSAWAPKYQNFYAPEILAKEKLGPWTDLYMGATTMLYLAAGENVLTQIPEDICKSLVSCVQRDPARRPQSIGKYFESFDAIARKTYGAPRYHEFVLPGI
jgi:hypothetical protein